MFKEIKHRSKDGKATILEQLYKTVITINIIQM